MDHFAAPYTLRLQCLLLLLWEVVLHYLLSGDDKRPYHSVLDHGEALEIRADVRSLLGAFTSLDDSLLRECAAQIGLLLHQVILCKCLLSEEYLVLLVALYLSEDILELLDSIREEGEYQGLE